MKTFVVVSDSHGYRKQIDKLGSLFAENDYIVHLGDGSSDMREIFSQYPDKMYLCRGNNDFTYGESEFIIEVEHVSILCCHGHKYGVKSGLARLALHAKQKGCEAVLYGHTHCASIDEVDGILCINPGALCDYTNPSYCYLVVHGDKITPTIVNLNHR